MPRFLTQLFAAVAAASFMGEFSTAFRIGTWNLRYDAKPDNITVQETLNTLSDPYLQPPFLNLTAEQPWSTRRVRVADQIISSGVVLAGFQEVLLRQLNDLDALLGDEWARVGVGRDDGAVRGEFSPIFYKKSVLKLDSWDSFWLSDTPFEPSKYPGAGSYRICTAARFTTADPTQPPKSFAVLNTHLDDQSDAQRRLGASLLLTRARYEAWKSGPRKPVFVIGDFNSPSNGSDSGAYALITGTTDPLTSAPAINTTFAAKYAVPPHTPQPQVEFRLYDALTQAPRARVGRGNCATFTGFKLASTPEEARKLWARIDFAFVGSNDGGWSVDALRVENAMADDGMFASDHRPVFVDLTLS